MLRNILCIAILTTASLSVLAAPVSADHCAEEPTPYVVFREDADGDGTPDGAFVCQGAEDVGLAYVSVLDREPGWSEDRYTNVYAAAITDEASPVGSNRADVLVSCTDKGDDGSGCDRYWLRARAQASGLTGDELTVVVFDRANDGDHRPFVCIYSSVAEYSCEEL